MPRDSGYSTRPGILSGNSMPMTLMLISLVTPVVAVVLGMVVLGEDLSWRTVAGGIMIMVGVRFVTRIS